MIGIRYSITPRTITPSNPEAGEIDALARPGV